jgi:hypothetical protein
MSKKFDIDNLTAELNNKVTIVGPSLTEIRGDVNNAPGITGIMLNDLSFGVSSGHDSLFNSRGILDQVSGVIGRGATSVAAVSGSEDLGAFIQDLAPRNLNQTIQAWTGSTKPVFSLSLLFLKLRVRDNISLKVQSLYSAVLPTTNVSAKIPVGNLSLTTIRAPLGYFPTSGKTAAGTCALQIGSWFKATNLICKNVDFSFSREVSTDGFPLFAVGTVVLEPYRMITFEEFRAYFINTPQSGSATVGLPPGEQ